MLKVFSVIKIKNRNLNALIDGIRILADPYEKQVAHITIRGPYSKKYNISEISDSIKNTKVEVEGVGNFFSTPDNSQNTIFFKCSSSHIEGIWYKKDYPYNPHLTIYDGLNRQFAEKLLNILTKYNIVFCFDVNELEYIESHPKQRNATLALEYDFKLLSYYLGEDIKYNDILNYTDEDRLGRIEKLINYYKSWNNKSVYPSPINSILTQLGLTKENGLFYLTDFDSWRKRFPYRILRAIMEIRPYAFFSLYKNEENNNLDHPQPFNQPILLFFDNPSTEQEKQIHRQVFSFGQAPIIFIERTNSLDVYNGLVFENNKKNDFLARIGGHATAFDFSFKNLLSGYAWERNYKKSFANVRKVDDYLLDNLSETREILITTFSLSPSIANSLLGRLLFVRYLIDREVEFKKDDDKHEDYFPGLDRHDRNREFLSIIANPKKLYTFFDYLESKLNGDLFPVTQEEKDVVNAKILEVLRQLFMGAKLFHDLHNNYVIQNSLFDVYDFKIIPIELISNIYEQFIGRKKRVENKSFYTPSFLVDYILSKTVSVHIENSNKTSCKVLDPSCGSGIFLIETLRKIIEKHLTINDENTISSSQLWKLVKDNIYGIDIDSDAIEVAIFSLYVTILDYIEPKIIAKNFKFEKLKNTNFFPAADFFDLNSLFNKRLKDVHFDFILGNPPWGHVDNSAYIEYCQYREKQEDKDPIGISDKQIAQAFLVRVSDFSTINTQFALVVTSKILYNTNAKQWRNYFLKNYLVNEVFELSAVNTKIFNGANWPSAIVFYSHISKEKSVDKNIVHHISLKPNKFFQYFKTIVIEKYDYKKIGQKYFIESLGGHDWLWKVLLYGNVLDYYFISRLKTEYKTIQQVIDDNNLFFGVGLKRKDSTKSKSALNLIDKPFLDTGIKDFKRFSAVPTAKWKEESAAVIPSALDQNGYPVLFKGPMALIKEGLDSGYTSVAAYYQEDIVFTHSVRAIKGEEKNITLLKSIVGELNSRLFTYYIFLTGTSTGIDFVRANQIEQFSFPAIIDERFNEIVDSLQELIANANTTILDNHVEHDIEKMNIKLEGLVAELFQIDDLEHDLINYTENISIPLSKISQAAKVYRPIAKSSNDIQYLKDYANVYIKHFAKRLANDNKYIHAEIFLDIDLIAINFIISSSQPQTTIVVKDCDDVLEILNDLFELSFRKITNQLYIQRDIKGFQAESFYVIKPNEYKCWHPAIARLDLGEFVDAIIKSGHKNQILS